MVAGEVLRGDPASGSIPLYNVGDAPLEIQGTEVRLPGIQLDPDRVIAPGKEGAIRWSVDTLLHDGGVRFWILVKSSDPVQPAQTVALDLQVTSTLFAKPKGARFQSVQHEADGTITNTLWAGDLEDFKVTGASVDRADLGVAFREATTEERLPQGKGRQWRLDITLPQTAAIGPIASVVTVNTNHPREPVLYLQVTGMMRPVFALTPTGIDYQPPVKPVTPVLDHIQIRNFATAPLLLGPVESPYPWLEVELEPIEAGRRYWLHFTLRPDAPKGPVSLTVRVKTPHPKVPWIEVPVTGSIE